MTTTFLSTSVYVGMVGLCAASANFLSTVVLAHLLGVEGTGIVAYTMWAVSVLVTISDLGIPLALARFLPELKAQGKAAEANNLAAALFKQFSLASVGLPASIMIAILVHYVFHSAKPTSVDVLIWPIACICCITQALANFGTSYLQGMQKFRCAAQVASLSVVIQIIGISVGAVTFGVTGALLGYVAGSAVPAFISLKAIRRNPGISAEIKTRVERHARYGWAGAIVAAFVWSRLEVFFLELSVGLGAVALFSAALAFSSLASQGPVLLTRGLFFYFCEEVGKNQTESLPEAFAAATRVTALLVFPACFGTAAIMPKLLPMIYGPEFAGAVPAASVLVCVAGITAAGTIGANLLAALERNDFIFFSGLLGALLATIVGLTIIPQFGIMGAAYGRAAVQTILLALGLWFIGTQAGFSIPYGGLARILAAATLCALAARMTITAIQGSGAIPIAIMTGVIAYVVAVRLVGGLNRGDSAKVLSLMLHLPQWLRAFPVAALKLMEAKS